MTRIFADDERVVELHPLPIPVAKVVPCAVGKGCQIHRLTPVRNNPHGFVCADEGAVQSSKLMPLSRFIQHVAATDEFLGSVLIQHDAGIDHAGDVECYPAWEVGFIIPVTTSVDGLCVARMRWIPTARAF